jgi:hypothetical protein
VDEPSLAFRTWPTLFTTVNQAVDDHIITITTTSSQSLPPPHDHHHHLTITITSSPSPSNFTMACSLGDAFYREKRRA